MGQRVLHLAVPTKALVWIYFGILSSQFVILSVVPEHFLRPVLTVVGGAVATILGIRFVACIVTEVDGSR